MSEWRPTWMCTGCSSVAAGTPRTTSPAATALPVIARRRLLRRGFRLSLAARACSAGSSGISRAPLGGGSAFAGGRARAQARTGFLDRGCLAGAGHDGWREGGDVLDGQGELGLGVGQRGERGASREPERGGEVAEGGPPPGGDVGDGDAGEGFEELQDG